MEIVDKSCCIFTLAIWPFSRYLLYASMSRQKLTLRLNADVIQKTKNAGMNLSYFLEVKLVEYPAILNETPRRRFELLRGGCLTRFPVSRRSRLGHLGKKQILGISLSFKTFSRWKDTFLYSSKPFQYWHTFQYLFE